MTCDNDGDEILKDEEIEDLIHRIEGIQGVDLNDELIRKKIVDSGASLNGTFFMPAHFSCFVSVAMTCSRSFADWNPFLY